MPDRSLLHELVSDQSRFSPESVAVVCGTEQISYGELDGRAVRLARFLRERGAGPETVVGLCLERGIDQVVALLAVMKAGAAYLPLDPADPPDRVAFMLADAGAPLVLSRSGITSPWPDGPWRVVDVDDTADEVARCSSAPLDTRGDADNAIYVIYTSGSTGTPKGVVVPHRAVVNLARAQRTLYRHGPGERVLQLAPVRFDASVFDFCLALCNGGTLVLLPPDTVGSGGDLLHVLEKYEVTTAAVLSAALQSMPRAELPRLRQLISGGEAVPPEVADHWAKGRTFVSAYGPTEAAVICTSGEVSPPVRDYPPIGVALPGTTVHVLDADMRPVAAGRRGEIYVGGAQVARGYVGRPAQTADRFVPDPFSDQPGARLYRTGDFGSRSEDGTVTFLGRVDDQVKIRGFRVELGEVEAHVLAHPDVREAAVSAREDTPGDKRLVAYVVAADGALSESRLRSDLRDRLPDYMVPAAVVVLGELPKTASGKVDRQALPRPSGSRAEDAGTHVAARTPAQQTIAAIWAEVLGVERIGLDDDFYDLGGHSLLAAQVMARVREAFGVDLQISALLDGPDVARLAARVESAHTNRTDGSGPGDTDGPIRFYDGDLAREQELPLSFDQERLWYLSELAAGQPFYNVALAFRLRGELDVPRLTRALDVLAERHAVLRTSFARVDGVPRQVVHPAAPVPLETVDVPDLDAARETTRTWLLRPFDLETAPPARYGLLRLADGEHVLLFVVHHILADGWSMSLLCEELSALCGGVELSPLDLQFADYARWQRERLESGALDGQRAYWKERLAGLVPLEVPTDHPRPAALSYAGDRLTFALPDDLVEELEATAKRASATLFTVLLAAFDALLSHWSGQSDIAVGVPVAGRSYRRLESLMGFLVNTVVLRTSCDGDPTLAELLDRVRADAHAAFDHQELPFEKLVEELAPARDLSRNPLVQVLFHVAGAREAGAGGLDLPGVAAEPFEVDVLTTRLDLEMQVAQDASGAWSGQLVYSTELFDEPTMRRLWARYVRVLRQFATRPDLPLSGLKLLSEEERYDVVSGFNRTEHPVPGLALHQLVAAQARRTPDRVAVVRGDASISYAELDARADRLAWTLYEHGLRPDSVVGVCLDRGIDSVVAQLAVLKAGGAFLPLSPGDPAERLAYMIGTAGASLVVSAPDVAQDWATPAGCQVVDVHTAGEERPGPPPVAVGPDHCAYVIFTSGSTGRPKGVMVPHRGIVNIALSSARTWGVESGTKVGQAVSPVFDVSVLDVYVALVSGAELHLATADDTSGPGLERFIKNSGIEIIQTVPALWSGLDPDSGVRLPRLVIGGEHLPAQTLRRWTGRIETVHHVYGLTELSVISTQATYLTADLGDDDAALPIGGPVDNTRVYLLDDRLQPVPVGTRGEICVGGTGVARGYAGQPALTAERFVPDPFDGRPGARLYRTGDFGRWTADGSVEFLGRADDQVKVRGFRVEPGEIEAQLLRHPGIREVAVITREDTPGDRRLVAYVVPTGPSVAEQELRTHVRDRLPHYMAPSAFVTLTELPKTTSGKADRRALPRPAAPSAEAAAVPRPAAAGSAVQGVVAGVWAEVLGVESVGAQDNFFDLGGHSLLAAQVVSRLRSEFGVELELSALLESPTLEELSGRVEAAGGQVESVSAGSAVQGVVAGVWAEVLGVESVGAQDNFFDLGGHSLLAAQVVSRLRSEFGVELELSALLESPTLEELSGRVEAAGGQVQGAGPARVFHGDLVGRTDLPMSFGQERLWFLGELAPHQPFYNVALGFRLRGTVDVARLSRALTTVAERHTVLRTTFGRVGGVPRQLVRPTAPVDVQLVDVSGADEARLLGERFGRDLFDLGADQLLRAGLYRIGADDHVLVIASHHIAADGWSLSVLTDELETLYAGGEPRTLDVQFADVAEWQRRRLHGPVLEELTSYWTERLAGLEPLELPTDRPRPATLNYVGHRIDFTVPADLVASLEGVAKRGSATLFMVFLAAFDALLSRWSGASDVAVGVPVAGRSYRELEHLIGFFANWLVLRTNCEGDPTYLDLLARVRESVHGALNHQELPFEKLVEELAPVRDLSRNPLVQVLFQVVQPTDSGSAAAARLDLDGLDVNPFHLDLVTTRADVELHLIEEDDGDWHGLVVYSADLFDAVTMRRLWDRYLLILRQIAHEPALRLSRLDLLTEEERHLLADTFGRRDTDLPAPLVQERVVERARSAPGALAVVAGEESLTYGELLDRAGGLAAALVKHGVGPETVVGVCAEPSADSVVGRLAVLLAGGAVLPLDPAASAQRRERIMREAGADALLTEAPADGATPWTQLHLRAHTGGAQPQVPVVGGSTAAVTVARGGTRMPLSHHALAARVAGCLDAHGLTSEDRLALLPDDAHTDSDVRLWAALAVGATVLIGPDRTERTAQGSAAWQAGHGVTVAVLDPASARDLSYGPHPGDTAPRLVITRGRGPEPRGASPSFEVADEYRPDESGPVCANGRLVGGLRAHVLDEELRPVPIGTTGQVYVAGPGLAHGYAGRASRTAAAFVPDPFSGVPGSRMLATGDRGRWNNDGTLTVFPAAPTAPRATAARNRIQEAVAEVWAEVLGRGSVGIYDDFYALGGDEERAAAISSRLTARLGLSIEPRIVLERRTIAEFTADARVRAGA
ncbi:amino acid adenylation domain-containing protein [Streptomyces sp. NPDC056948]|uniref:amino acid adenylation domain-containing protein n=1 Tax=Streptomyces sp. NPDC056948 TaxID=3345975 RepID=UPI0036448FA0